MNLFESMSSGLGALWGHKLRSALTLVGIVVVAGFYVIFAELLLVPLPVGSLFG